MNRQAFHKLCASIIGGLGIPGLFGNSNYAAETGPGNSGAPLDDSYLVKGITGMARANGWFEAHWGASILAGYFLCRDNHLEQETTLAIRKQLDTMIRLQPAQFAPLAEESADEALIEDVLKALLPAMQGGLRAHGHAVIFTSLSVKALRNAPHMAQPAIIKRLCGLNSQIAKISPQKAPAPETPYNNTQGMIEATFDSLSRFKGLLGRPSIRRPNFTHMVTHTEALLNLDLMGYPQIVSAGHAGHQAHIAAQVPEIDPTTQASADSVSLESVMSRDFWNDPRNEERWSQKWSEKENPNGYWVAFGHLFKVLYSFHRLVQHIDDKEKVRLCTNILLERYLNPAVQGG